MIDVFEILLKLVSVTCQVSECVVNLKYEAYLFTLYFIESRLYKRKPGTNCVMKESWRRCPKHRGWINRNQYSRVTFQHRIPVTQTQDVFRYIPENVSRSEGILGPDNEKYDFACIQRLEKSGFAPGRTATF